ncbi:uncharacterized protein ACWYII_008524 isoform 2-T2 [Salvelinus alpinus]
MENVEDPSDPSERGGGHMISTDDLEYPREYRTLGNGTRRFSNVGLVHTSEHRHTVIRSPEPGGPYQPAQGGHGAQEGRLHGPPEEQVPAPAAAPRASAPQPPFALTLPRQHEAA